MRGEFSKGKIKKGWHKCWICGNHITFMDSHQQQYDANVVLDRELKRHYVCNSCYSDTKMDRCIGEETIVTVYKGSCD